MKVKVLVVLTLLLAISSCQEKMTNQQDSSIHSIDTNIISGVYISIDDPKSSIEIKNNKYFMHYDGMKASSDSIYDMDFIDSITNYGHVYSKGKYLRLKNGDEILEYKINSWDTDTISLTYLPRGNTLTYKKK